MSPPSNHSRISADSSSLETNTGGAKPLKGRSPSRVGGKAALGNNTKSVTPCKEDPQQAKAVYPPSYENEKNEAETRRSNRTKRYEYQNVARDLLMNEGRKIGLKYPANYHRTAKCLYIPIGMTTVNRDKERNTAFFGGLPQCGSIWSCPLCASKVQERRREEIATAMGWAYLNGYKCIMVTLTFPHYAWQDLHELLKQQALALNKLRAGKPWEKVKAEMGFKGLIRGLELTYGFNGWHPHSHEVWIVEQSADPDVIRVRTMERWKKACIKAGLLDAENVSQVNAFISRSVDVIDWVSSSAYLAKQDDIRKWGIDRELAKSSTKQGRKSGRHPFNFLETATYENDDGRLFLNYCQAMKGRRQIFWSHGLKEKVRVEEKTDEELVSEKRETADVLTILSKEQWLIVTRENARSEILDIAETLGFEGLRIWFANREAIIQIG